MTSLGEHLWRVLHEGNADRIVATYVALDGSCRHATVAEFAGAARSAAGAVRKLGLAPRAFVGIAHASGPGLHAAWLGALWAGLVPTILAPPSPRMEPRKYAEGFRSIVSQLRLDAILTDEPTRGALGALLPAHCPVVTMPTGAPGEQISSPPEPVDADAEAVVQHTSGTTGAQKAIGLTSRQILGFIEAYAECLDLRDDDATVSWLPLYHDMGFIACFVLPLVTGRRLVEMSPFDWLQRPALLFDAIAAHGGTLCWLPNFAFNVLSEERVLRPAEERGCAWRLERMRAFINCSEPVMAGSIDRFVSRLARHGVRRGQVIASYAMAESVFAVTHNAIGSPVVRSFAKPALQSEGKAVPARATDRETVDLISSGRVLAPMRVEVRGPRGDVLGDGRIGEIFVAGPFRFDGYRGRPDLNQRAIDAGGCFATGDLGFICDGELFVTGRSKDLIIIRGRNYYPQDIEAAAGAVEGVKAGRVAAFSVPDPGAGTEKLVVMLELEDGRDADTTGIIVAVRRAVAQGLDCVIGDLRIVPPRALVKSTPGKVARADNRRRYLEQLVAPAAGHPDHVR